MNGGACMTYVKRIFWVSLMLSFAAAASAEFYKYIDKDGRVRFTDNYYQVPEDQRKRMEKYIEYKEKSGDQAKEREREDLSSKEDPGETEKNKVQMNLDETRNRLESTRQELLLEYEALMKEKEQLETERKNSPKTRKATEEYNKKASALNRSVKEYEDKLAVHNREVESYNAKVNEKSEAAEKEAKKQTEKK